MDKYLRKAAKLAKKGDYTQAGNLYEIAGELESAAKMYTRGGALIQAARLYEGLKFNLKAAELYKRAGNFMKAAELFSLGENYLKAAEMYSRINKHFNAAEMYKRAKKHLQAAQHYEKATQFEAAGDMYLTCNRTLNASECFTKALKAVLSKKEDEILLRDRELNSKRLAGKAADAFLSSARPLDAAKVLRLAGEFEKAANIYYREKQYNEALEAYFAAKKYKTALKIIDLEKSESIDFEYYASQLNNAGLFEESAVLYAKMGKHEEAGYQYQLAGDLRKAALHFEKAGIFSMAGHCYLEEEDYPQSANMFLKAGNYRFAADAYLKAGNSKMALRCLVQLKEYIKAADIASEVANDNTVISILEHISEDSPDYLEATYRLGMLYFKLEKYEKAKDKFQVLQNEQQLNPHKEETYYYLGRIYEEQKAYTKANEYYGYIEEGNKAFPDLEKRTARLKKILTKRSEKRTTSKIRVLAEDSHQASLFYASLLSERFVREATLGRGAVGVIYRATDTVLRRVVALKVIAKSQFEQDIQINRFRMKMQKGARLSHPNIVTIYDMWEDEENLYIVREYVPGINLRQYLRRSRPPQHKIMVLVRECLAALESAHQVGVFHRNLCPENVLITEDEHVKLSDFGLYFKTDSVKSGDSTAVKLKEKFLSPGTLQGKPANIQDDLISCAQLIIYMVLGVQELNAEEQSRSKPWHNNIKISERLRKVLDRSTSNKENERYKSAAEMAGSLKSEALEPGSLFDNRYEIISEMGKGGMGTVFKAHDRVLKELVALKTLRAGAIKDERNLQRFKWEIIAARKISHPNVIRIHHLGYYEGIYYISMELIYGITLKELINQGVALPVDKRLSILIQIVQALGAVHKVEIIHRDVKPQNILLDKDYNVKLVDFGIARVGDTQGVTETGEVMGTPEYMAPEQIKKQLDTRSDIYSLGIVMFEFLTGELPFYGDSPISILMAHLKKNPPLPSSLNPAIEPRMEQIVLKCLQKSPAARYQSMDELALDLVAHRDAVLENIK